MLTLNYDKIREKIHINEYPEGLKAFVIPKRGYQKKYAAYAVHYGSINNMFTIPAESAVTAVPDGIAHFLEHKLFEQEDGNVMDKFSALGSSPNAYTGFYQTVYLFSCTDMFMKNFGLLSNYVQNPYITEESVEKEKGIIGQEINMYRDDPDWRGYFNFLNALYVSHPVKTDIAGTIDSIAGITAETLYKCHSTFYRPSNMVIIVTGDVEPGRIFDRIGESIQKSGLAKGEIKRIFPEEPLQINKPYVEQEMQVSAPIFTLGYKDSLPVCKGTGYLMKETAVRIILEAVMGKSSVMYGDLYSKGLINETFDSSYTAEENYAYLMSGGESPDPEAAREGMLRHIAEARINGIGRENFERLKKAFAGSFVKGFNSVERISNAFISTYFKEVSIFDYIDIFDKITYDYVNHVFEELFNDRYMAMSVIKPVKGGS